MCHLFKCNYSCSSLRQLPTPADGATNLQLCPFILVCRCLFYYHPLKSLTIAFLTFGCVNVPPYPSIVARKPLKRETKASAHFVAFSSSDNNVKTAVPLPQKLSYFCWCVFFFILHLCPCRLPSLDGAILFQLCPSLVCCVSCSCQWCNINYKLPFAFVVPSLLYLLVLAFCPPCVVQFN